MTQRELIDYCNGLPDYIDCIECEKEYKEACERFEGKYKTIPFLEDRELFNEGVLYTDEEV